MPDSLQRFRLFQAFWALLGMALIGVTWKLWTPQTVFPQIPFFEWLVEAPGWIDWVAIALAVGGLFTVLTVNIGSLNSNRPEFNQEPSGLARAKVASIGNRSRVGLFLFAASMIVLIALNQHRLQPWAYQFLVYAIIMLGCKRRDAIKLMGWITISIYIYSAISKFDYQFVHTVGRDFLGTLVGLVGVDLANLDETLVSRTVLLLPTFEFCAGVALIFKRTRRYAMGAVLAMHLTLLLILGPLGLNHSWGVLVWNVFLIGNLVLLLECTKDGKANSPIRKMREASDPIADALAARRRRNSIFGWMGEMVGFCVAMFVLIFPLNVIAGVGDAWLGWEVYAPRSSRVDQGNFWRTRASDYPGVNGESNLEQRSLDSLGVPLYPNKRFQFGVAYSEISDLNSIEIGHVSDRFTGARHWDNCRIVVPVFLLNTKARWPSRQIDD